MAAVNAFVTPIMLIAIFFIVIPLFGLEVTVAGLDIVVDTLRRLVVAAVVSRPS